MIIEGRMYSVTINDLYVDDKSFRLIMKGEIHHNTKKHLDSPILTNG